MIRCRLSAILGARRIKLTEVSRETGISRVTLTNLYYERNSGITMGVLDKLCKYLGCKVSDLLEYEEGRYDV